MEPCLDLGNIIEFSVVIPARNAEKTIGKCLESVLNQKYAKEKYEVIVIDNNSVDDTAAVIKQFPVTYLLQKKPGAAATRNKGIKKAKGKIIAFIDSDRFAQENWLLEASKELKKNNIDLVAGKILPIQNISISRKVTMDMAMNQEFFVEKGYAATCNLFVKRDCFSRIGLFDEKLWLTCEDAEWGLRAKEAGCKLEYSDKIVVYYNSRNFLAQMKKEFRRGRAVTHLKRMTNKKPYLKKATGTKSSFRLLKRALKKNEGSVVGLFLVIFQGIGFKLSAIAGELFEKFV